ncbi:MULTISPECIES: hypothetical protein [unclassified Rathayibacter]|uniref:hypothetical protein n=1 Tax=unclassified Rathayibacter TaxID=2609250 RepID=UPI000F4C1274|nr:MULTISPECIES: hypothetical protein [unclassified Rathayibacter]ROP48230.1 hypothetical protein EDF45_3376 [Rathayibacter sp. PhB186]ROS48584.1 hypothetical protein EDF44_3216 [Rathayibacter sp. PhB185]TCL83577.1 hypothetical protein EDF49_1036 [Rathayibacter sp. PhB192]TCM29170.1 hypothetical protein EDF43_1036 [Rathayibacter sp. PhB179]
MSTHRSHGLSKVLRITALTVAAGASLWLLGDYAGRWPDRVPSAGAPTAAPTFSPAGAVYRYGYWGGLKNPTSSRPIQWLEDGSTFTMTTGGSGQCLNEPVALEVVAPDHLRIESKLQEDPQEEGCSESYVLASYVLDTPAGLDPTHIVKVERTQAGRAGSSSVYVAPLP